MEQKKTQEEREIEKRKESERIKYLNVKNEKEEAIKKDLEVNKEK